ncbi:MAG: Nramp family divalent metal transporter [Planctomycetales bacterium]|nr:Nramp family divalent metal transporter [Planctomycetales bacterium]
MRSADKETDVPNEGGSPSRDRKRRTLIALVGPGLMLAASGVGAGDLAGGAFAGIKLGTAVLWAVLCGAAFKFVVTEGLARWQLATGTTLLEGAVLRLGRPVQWGFLVYLLVWTFGVGTSLISACGVAAHALFPVFDDPVRGKIVWGIVHSLIGLAMVWWGTFRFFERMMGVLVAIMVVVVLVTGWMVKPDWLSVSRGLFVPNIPDQPEAVAWTLALMGGVGGTLTVLCYGYWIREEERTGTEDLALCRLDLGMSYAVMALFGIAMVIIATGVSLEGAGAKLLVELAERLQQSLGSTARHLFLVGAWAAVFSSLVGVWQAVPYLFADFWQLLRRRGKLEAETFLPAPVDKRGWAYRGYLLALALVPMLGLQYNFQLVQKANSVFGALVMPMLAAALLVMNGRSDWIGAHNRNRWWTTAALIGILVFFAVVGLPSVIEALTF